MSKTKTITWQECLFIAFEFNRCDRCGNIIYEAYFLAHGDIFHHFYMYGASTTYNTLERAKPLTKFAVTFEWRYGKKWLRELKAI